MKIDIKYVVMTVLGILLMFLIVLCWGSYLLENFLPRVIGYGWQLLSLGIMGLYAYGIKKYTQIRIKLKIDIFYIAGAFVAIVASLLISQIALFHEHRILYYINVLLISPVIGASIWMTFGYQFSASKHAQFSRSLDWKQSPPHIFFLTTFLFPRTEDKLPVMSLQEWSSTLGESPHTATQRFLDDHMIEVDTYEMRLNNRFNVKELKEILRDAGLSTAGKKEQLINRLIRADIKKVKNLVADYQLLRCTDEGRKIAETHLKSLSEEEPQELSRKLRIPFIKIKEIVKFFLVSAGAGIIGNRADAKLLNTVDQYMEGTGPEISQTSPTMSSTLTESHPEPQTDIADLPSPKIPAVSSTEEKNPAPPTPDHSMDRGWSHADFGIIKTSTVTISNTFLETLNHLQENLEDFLQHEDLSAFDFHFPDELHHVPFSDFSNDPNTLDYPK